MTEPESSEEYEAKPQPAMLKQLNDSQFDPLEAVGGIRGAIESSLPGLVFVVVYVLTSDLRSTLIGAVATALVLIFIRFATRQPLTYSVSGLIGVGIGVVWAALSGRGEDFYSMGLFTTALYATGIGIGMLARFPVVSALLTPVWDLSWRWWEFSPPEHARLVKATWWLSWMWFSLFAIRLLVQVPLWLAGNVAWLGAAKLALGLPPFILCAWITWVVLRPLKPDPETECEYQKLP